MLQNNFNYEASQNIMSHLQRRRIFKRRKPPDETYSNNGFFTRYKFMKTKFIILWIITSMFGVVNASENFFLKSETSPTKMSIEVSDNNKNGSKEYLNLLIEKLL